MADKPDEKPIIQGLEEKLAAQEAEIQSLWATQAKLGRFLDNIPIMVFALNRQQRLIRLNRTGCRLLGFASEQEALGEAVAGFFKEPAELENLRKGLRQDGAVKDFEAVLHSRSGQEFYVQINAAQRLDSSGGWEGVDGFAQEITPRKMAQKALKESEEKYRTVLENSLAAIYMFHDGGVFSYANHRLVDLLGYDSVEEIIGKPFWSIVAPEDRELVKRRGLEREKQEINPRRYPFRLIKKDGTRVWVDMQASHASYQGHPAVVGNWIDITKRKKAEEEVRRLSRSLIEVIEEERRTLAADLHDEFGQSLTLLRFDVEALQRILAEDETKAHQICGKVIGQIRSLAAGIRATTSRLRPDLLDHLGLVPALEWYVEDFNKRTTDIDLQFHAVGLKKRLPPEAELVLYRVFQEGLNNVLKHARASRVVVRLTASHPKVVLLIDDNGRGFEQDESGMPLDRNSKGIGLLAMQERVASLGGSLQINSAPGKGAVIRVEMALEE
jgi:two-component system sensor histidine kinase UhpB